MADQAAYHTALDMLRRCAERQAENPMAPGAMELAGVELCTADPCDCLAGTGRRVEPDRVAADAWERLQEGLLVLCSRP